jgi:hypothetical protein
MKITYFVLNLLFLFFTPIMAQNNNKLVAEQDAILAYMAKYETLQENINNNIAQFNTFTIDAQIPKAEMQREQRKYAAKIEQDIKNYSLINPPKACVELRKKMIIYLSKITLTLTKTINETYLRQAEKELNCKGCISAMIYSYVIRQNDPETNGDAILKEMDNQIVAIAKEYGFETTEPVEERKREAYLKNANNHQVYLFAVLGHAVTAHNSMGFAIQQVYAGKGDLASLNAALSVYQSDCKQTLVLLEKSPKHFENDYTVWQSTKKLCDANTNLAQKVLPSILPLMVKTKPTTAEISKIEGQMKAFFDIRIEIDNCERVATAFLHKIIRQK